MSKKVELIRSSNMADVDYAYGSRVPAGMDLLFMAGACPLDKEGDIPDGSDYALQAQLCIDNLIEALKASDATLENVVYTRVLVASQNRDDLVTAWHTIRAAFGDHDVPSTLTGVTILGYENQLVEIEAIAGIPANPEI